MRIGELARRTGVSVRSLRYYETQGLLRSDRTPGGHREYAEAGILVNTSGRVPIDEAAPCYKPSGEIIEAVVGAGLASVEYRLWPLASLKGEDERRSKRSKNPGKKKTSDHY